MAMLAIAPKVESDEAREVRLRYNNSRKALLNERQRVQQAAKIGGRGGKPKLDESPNKSNQDEGPSDLFWLDLPPGSIPIKLPPCYNHRKSGISSVIRQSFISTSSPAARRPATTSISAADTVGEGDGRKAGLRGILAALLPASSRESSKAAVDGRASGRDSEGSFSTPTGSSGDGSLSNASSVLGPRLV